MIFKNARCGTTTSSIETGSGAGVDGAREQGFVSVAEYQEFVKGLLARLNAGRKARLAEEIAVMRELPERRLESCKRERVKVDSGSLIYTDRNVYSVPSR